MSDILKNNQYEILIVDDEKDVLDKTIALLEDDFKIITANNGEEALKQVEKYHEEIDLILLDLNMEGIHGLDVLNSLKSSSIFSKIPVVVQTSHNTKEAESDSLLNGAIDIVDKSIDVNILKKRLCNIIDLKKSSYKLEQLEKDELTNVYSRSAFYLHAKEFLLDQNEYYDLVISDIVDFKILNEKYGEKKSDSVLKYAAQFIRDNIAFGRLAGRYGSDKFIAIVKKSYIPTDAMINEQLTKFQENAPVKNLKCKFCVYENVNGDSQLTLCASYALTSLKKISNEYDVNIIVFNEEAKIENQRIAKLTEGMEDTVKNEEFKVYFQPKHETVSGKLVGAEALIRWQHPEFGMIPPNDFIPLFESNGFISRADYYVWKKTCQYLRKWMDKGISVVPISINASKIDFEVENYFELLKKPVNENNLNPNLLHIEVTETMENRDINTLINRLTQLREYGFRIELDDFGSGYSSLNILGSLPLDVVKIDQSFIRQIDDPRKARILSSCITLTKNLGLVSVCEGVETEEQRNVLKSIGCDRIQGYYFSKPLPADEFEQYLIDQKNKKIEQDYVQYLVKSSAYIVDEDFNVVSYNKQVKTDFPEIKKGLKCYETMHGKKEPCFFCPITTDQKGPKTIIDMAHNRFTLIDGTDMPIDNGDKQGYLITVGYTKNLL